MVKQAKSKQKILDKMEAAGLTPPVQHESTFHFNFPDCDKLPPPVLPFQDVSFAYSGQDKDCLYRVSPVTVYCLPFCVLFGPLGFPFQTSDLPTLVRNKDCLYRVSLAVSHCLPCCVVSDWQRVNIGLG